MKQYMLELFEKLFSFLFGSSISNAINSLSQEFIGKYNINMICEGTYRGEKVIEVYVLGTDEIARTYLPVSHEGFTVLIRPSRQIIPESMR